MHEFIQDLKLILENTEKHVRSKNFYYDTHNCKDIENKKVTMDYIIKKDGGDKIVRAGFCPECKTLIYHESYDTKL